MKPQVLTQTFVFIMGGVSKAGKPYLQVSNGRDSFFVSIPKSVSVNEETFAPYATDDEITLKVSVRVGSEGVTLQEVVKKV